MKQMFTAAAAITLAGAALSGSAFAQYPYGYGGSGVPVYAPAPIPQMSGGGSYNYWNATGSYTSGFQSPYAAHVQGQHFSVGGYQGSNGYGAYYNAGQFSQGSHLTPIGTYSYGQYSNQGQYNNMRYYYPR